MFKSRRLAALLLSAGAVSIAGMCAPAHAGLVFTNDGTATATSTWATVAGDSLVYSSLSAPSTTVASTGQGNVNAATNATFVGMVETFTPSSSYTLGAIGISAASSGADPITLVLYNVTSALTSNNGSVTQGSGATYSPSSSGLTDLLGGGAGLQFKNGTTQAQMTFQLTGSDEISLTAGQTYAVEFWSPVAAGANAFTWYRGGVVATDGQMMTTADASDTGTGASTVSANFTQEDSRITIASAGQAGGAPRTASLALYAVVPEPTSIGMIAVGAMGLLARRRRQA